MRHIFFFLLLIISMLSMPLDGWASNHDGDSSEDSQDTRPVTPSSELEEEVPSWAAKLFDGDYRSPPKKPKNSLENPHGESPEKIEPQPKAVSSFDECLKRSSVAHEFALQSPLAIVSIASPLMLSWLPLEKGGWHFLKTLTIIKCGLTTVPKQLWTLKSLEHLNLAYNKLTDLSEEIGQLKQLTLLNLRANNLAVLPSAILELKDLCYLNVQENEGISLSNVERLVMLRILQQ